MRKKIVILIGVMILMSLLSLSGCSLPPSEYQLKKNAEKLLEDKYGEEFVVNKIWGKGGETFDASCSPKSDKSIVFEGFYPNSGDGNFKDEYVQALVGKELEKRLSPSIKKISDDFLVKPLVFYKESNFTNKKDVTLEKYVDQVEDARCYFVICINKDKIKNISLQEEYKIFAELFPKVSLINGSVELYFVDSKVLNKCKDFFSRNTHMYAEFQEIIKSNKDMGFGYPNGKINKTFEEYSKLRQEIK